MISRDKLPVPFINWKHRNLFIITPGLLDAAGRQITDYISEKLYKNISANNESENWWAGFDLRVTVFLPLN